MKVGDIVQRAGVNRKYEVLALSERGMYYGSRKCGLIVPHSVFYTRNLNEMH